MSVAGALSGHAGSTPAGGVSLRSFVIGPEAQGRGFRILAPAKLSFAGAGDVAMILMEWARTGERDFAGCLPLPDGGKVIVFRGRHIGREELGEAAYLNGVLLEKREIAFLGGRTELLLPFIPAPDGSQLFAEAPFDLDRVPDPGEPKPWPGLGLAWQDRQIVTDDPDARERLLLRALASIEPSEQRARVSGWVTSAQLVSRGGIDPLGISQLVVNHAAADAATGRHLRVMVSGQRIRGKSVAEPESWTAWRQIHATTIEPYYRDLRDVPRWRPDYARLAADDVAEEALRLATSILPVDRMADLLAEALLPDRPYAAAAANVARDYVDALAGHPSSMRVVTRLLDAGPPPPALAPALLRAFGVGEGGDAAQAGELERILEAARDHLCNRAAVPEAAERRGLVQVLKASIPYLDERPRLEEIVCDIIDSWPCASKPELFSLTSQLTFTMLLEKSRVTASRLAFSALRRDWYGFGSSGDFAVGLRDTLRAIALLRPH